MKLSLIPVFALIVTLTMISTTPMPGEDATVQLRPGGLPNGAPENVLPNGAILHARFNAPATTLQDLEKLIVSFIPVEALPLALKPLMETPHPLFAFIGLNTLGKPITLSDIEKMFGLDFSRPITISMYLERRGQNEPAFVISIPTSDLKLITSLIVNLTKTQFASERSFNGHPYMVFGTSVPFNTVLYIACSDDTVYLCSSPAMLNALFSMKPTFRMAANTTITRLIADNVSNDVSVSFYPTLLQQTVPDLIWTQAALPDKLLAILKAKIHNTVPQRKIDYLSFRLREQFGIKDVDQLLDYASCVASATYTTLSGMIFSGVMNLDGIVLNVDVGAVQQKVSLRFYSKSIKPENFRQAIPLNDAVKALEEFAADINAFRITGRAAPSPKSLIVEKWLNLMRKKLQTKGLKTTWVDALIAYQKIYTPPKKLASITPWQIRLTRTADDTIPYQNIHSFKQLIKMEQQQYSRSVKATWRITPKLTDAALSDFFKQQAKMNRDNASAYTALLKATIGDSRWIDADYRFRKENDGTGVKRLIIENVRTTRSGFFGYSQHELINRKIIAYRTVGDYTVLQTQRKNGDIQLAGLKTNRKPLPPAVQELLQQAPAGCSRITIRKYLQNINEIVAMFNMLETIAHREIDTYLNDCNAILARHNGNLNAAVKEIKATKTMPFTILTVHRNPRTGKLYCMLLGNLRYPRPTLSPLLEDLFADYKKSADSTGGGMTYTHTAAGVWETGIVQRTDGLATLATSIVNRFIKTYHPFKNGPTELIQKIRVEGDGVRSDDPVVLASPYLDVLLVRRREQIIYGNHNADY